MPVIFAVTAAHICVCVSFELKKEKIKIHLLSAIPRYFSMTLYGKIALFTLHYSILFKLTIIKITDQMLSNLSRNNMKHFWFSV